MNRAFLAVLVLGALALGVFSLFYFRKRSLPQAEITKQDQPKKTVPSTALKGGPDTVTDPLVGPLDRVPIEQTGRNTLKEPTMTAERVLTTDEAVKSCQQNVYKRWYDGEITDEQFPGEFIKCDGVKGV